MNPFKRLASQTAIYGLPTIMGRLLNYFLVPLYTYNFSTEEYGVVNEMYAYVSFLLIVLTYGMETALFNFSSKTSNKEGVYKSILTSVTFTSAIFVLLFTVFSQPVAHLIQHPGHPEYVMWFAWILGMDSVSSIAFARLREQQRAKRFAAIKTLNIGVNIFFNLFFILGPLNSPEGRVGIGYIFISNVIASAVTLLALAPMLRPLFTSPFRGAGKAVFSYALPLLFAGLAGMTNETIDRILLKYLLPADIALEQVGIYGACYKISIIMTMFVQTFRFAAEPFFFYHAKETDAKKVYARVMDYFVIVCMLIFLGTMMNISWIQYFIGKDFRGGLEVVPILLMANFCLGVFFNLSIWYKLTGKTKWGAYLTVFGAAITLLGNFIFIPRYGYMASAWTTLACYAGMMFLSFILGNKFYDVKYDLKRFVGYIVLALILYFTATLFEIRNEALDLIAKNSMLLFFIIIVFIFERRKLMQK